MTIRLFLGFLSPGAFWPFYPPRVFLSFYSRNLLCILLSSLEFIYDILEDYLVNFYYISLFDDIIDIGNICDVFVSHLIFFLKTLINILLEVLNHHFSEILMELLV